MEGIVAAKEKKVGEASRVLIEAGRVLRLARTRVEATEREVSGREQQLKEARRRLNGNQEKAALASMEEWQALVKHGNTSHDLRSQKENLLEAKRREDEEEKKEFLRQQKFRKAEREASVRKAAEAAEVKASRLQGVLDEARENLIHLLCFYAAQR